MLSEDFTTHLAQATAHEIVHRVIKGLSHVAYVLLELDQIVMRMAICKENRHGHFFAGNQMKHMSLRFVFRMALGALAIVSAASLVHAVPVIGLTQSNSLITFDTATPGATTGPVSVTGLGVGEVLVGIDFRPATGQLFGIGSGSNLYIINAATGAATLVAPLTATITGTSFGIDFNPVVDRLRIVSDANQNLRVNPANGATIIDGILNPGDPNFVGAAYTNSFAGGATLTMLYVLDSSTNSLLRSTNPNAGSYVSVGLLSVDFDDNVGFDIFGAMSAFASLNNIRGTATGFYSIELSTGVATLVGDIGGGSLLADIAISIAEPEAQVPLPSTIALLGLGLAGLGWSRRRK